MSDEQKAHQNLLRDIVEIEHEMFQRVRTLEPSRCKDHPETFRVMRRMSHSVLSKETLKSYFDDLKGALDNDRNLLTEKYARMDSLIPPISTNPKIEKIVSIEASWMGALIEKYPMSFKGKGKAFEIYLSRELETYSDKTLELYYNDVSKAKRDGRNLAEERYTNLFGEIGYSSISEMEKDIRMRQG